MDQPQEYFEQRATRLRPRDSRLELETFTPLAHSMGRMSQPFRAAWGWGVEGKGAAHAGNAVRAIAWRPVHYASGHLKTISFNSFSFLGLLKTTASQAASSSQIRIRLGLRFPARERERERDLCGPLDAHPKCGSRRINVCVKCAWRQRVLSGQEAVPASR